jgi:hypothetical protein
MKKISRNEQILLVVMVGVAATFFFMKKVDDPLRKEIKKLITVNNELVGKIRDLREQPVETAHLTKAIAAIDKEMSGELARYDSLTREKLVNRARVQEKALEVSGMVSDNGLVVREMTELTAEAAAGQALSSDLGLWKKEFGLAAYSLKIEGDFLDMVHFMSEYLNQERLSIAGNVKIKGTSDQGAVSAECVLVF